MKNLKVLTQYDCPACHGTGRTKPPPDYIEGSLKLYQLPIS